MHDLVGNRSEDGIEFVHLEELQIGIRIPHPPPLGTRRPADRIALGPPPLDRMLECAVKQNQDVPDALRLQARRSHRGGKRLDISRVHAKADATALLIAIGYGPHDDGPRSRTRDAAP